MTAPKGNTYAKGNKGGSGRPSRYKKEFDKQAEEMCRRGFIDDDLAAVFGVTDTTINNWKLKYQSFLASTQRTKPVADANVKQALYNRAIGGIKYVETRTTVDPSGEETVTTIEKTSIPETAACIFWLCNRDPDNWQRNPESNNSTNGTDTDLALAFMKLSSVLPT